MLTRILRRACAIASMHVVGALAAIATGEWWAVFIPVPIFGAVPSSLTEDYGSLLTTTLKGYQPRLRDNISRGNRLVAFLRMKGRWRQQNGGQNVAIPLMYAENTAADIYSGYGQIDTTPQDGLTTAFFDWSQMSVPITISRKEERQNSGASRILSLLESKTRQSEVTATELLNHAIVSGRITTSPSALGQFLRLTGRLDSGALAPLPLAALIDANPARSVSIGNINGGTYTFWRNQADASSATTFAGNKQEMNNIYNDCSKGAGGSPDLILGDQVGWEQYFNSLQSQERYIVTDQRVVDVLGGPGGNTDLIRFRGATYIWDEVVPDVQTPATLAGPRPNDAAVGTASESTEFYINSEAMEYVVDSETDWITTPFVRPENQDARTALMLWMGCLGVNNRRKLGVRFSISRSITA